MTLHPTVARLPASLLSLSSLPRKLGAELDRLVSYGYHTVEEVLRRLGPDADLLAGEVERLDAEFSTLVPIHDLLHANMSELVRSTGRLPSLTLGWGPAHLAFRGDAALSAADQALVRAAFHERVRARESAAVREVAQREAWAHRPQPALVPLWAGLKQQRTQLRNHHHPEDFVGGPHPEGFVSVTFVEEPLVMVLVVAGRKVAIQVPDGLTDIRFDYVPNDGRWALAAIDHVLDWISDRSSPEHAALVEWLTRPRWEVDLGVLDRSLAVLGRGGDPEPLGWRVVVSHAGLGFRPVRCTPRKRGAGWTLKNTTWQGINAAMMSDDADPRVVGLLSPWKVGQAPANVSAVAAEALIGHPRVFADGGTPVRVRRAALSLAVDDTPDGVRVRAEVGGAPIDVRGLADYGRASTGTTWVRLGEDTLDVVEVNVGLARALSGWLARGGLMPRAALDALLARLPTLTALVPIALSPSLRGDQVDGDPRPLVTVGWEDGVLSVDVHVRPLPDGAPHRPGEGPTEVVVVRDGAAAHFQRDLTAEPDAVNGLLAPLGLPDRARVGWTWTLTDPDAVRDALLALSEAGAALQLQWDGEPPTVSRARVERVRIRVASGRDWFRVDGALETDDGDVALADVLAALRDGRSYLQVRPNVFARVAELAAALGPVAAAAEPDGTLSPVQAPVLDAAGEAGADVDGTELFKASLARIRAAATLAPALPDGLTAELRAYQRDGYIWATRVASWAPGAVLADDMGLGKTVQAIAVLLSRPGPALVVCPLSVVAGWEAELARFAPGLQVVRYRGVDRAKALAGLADRSVVVTTWDLLARDADALAAVRFGTAVLDEAQAIKNAHTARSRGAAALCAAFILALTGTPVENRSEELWSLFRVVAPGLLGGEKRFAERFAAPITAGDPGARRALAAVVRPFVLRRTKREVATDLPARTEVVVKVPLSSEERALYERARLEAVARTTALDTSRRRFEVLRWLTRLRQLACDPRLVDPGSPVASSKLAQLRRRVADLRASGHRALVFSQFVTHLELVRDQLAADGARMCWLTGDVSDRDRRAQIRAFQAGEADVFLISLGAGGTGLNLTAATYVFHLDPWWNPAREDQASDRAHRIGQTEPVTVYRLVAEGTIEEQILALHAEKRELADALLSGADGAANVDTDTLIGLLAGDAVFDAEPVPDVPDVPPAAEPGLVEAFEAAIDVELAAGKLTPSTARAYVGAVRRYAAWAGSVAGRGPVAELAGRTRAYLAEVASGRLPHRSDKTFGPPAFNRLIALATDRARGG